MLELLERGHERLGREPAAVLAEPAETDGLGSRRFEVHGRAASGNVGWSSRHPADCTVPIRIAGSAGYWSICQSQGRVDSRDLVDGEIDRVGSEPLAEPGSDRGVELLERRFARRLDEPPELGRILATGRRPRRPLDTSTPHGRTRRIASPTFSGVRPPASRMRLPRGAPSARRQSNTLPEPGIGRVDEDDVGRARCRGRERGIAGRERLDHELHALADPLHLARPVRGRATARPRSPARPTISTIRSGRSLRKTPTVCTSRGSRRTMSRTVSACDLAHARREHEAERVGVERGREQRVVLVGDPADLDEHAGHPISGPTLDRRGA